MRLARPAAAAALLTAGIVLTAPAALAQAPAVEPYSEVEVEPNVLVKTPPTTTTTQARPSVNRTGPATLPFTGGELVGITAAGTALTAAGVGLVVAGRRRRSA